MIIRDGFGYRLALGGDAVDHCRAEHLMAAAEVALATCPAEARRHLEEARALWRGEPWAEVAGEAWMTEEIVAVATLRRRIDGTLVEALLQLDQLTEATTLARAMVTEAPFDEEARALLMRALYRAVGPED